MANIDIRVGKKDAVFFSANPTLILKDGQFLFNSDTLELFIGDGTSQLSALVAINVPPSSGVQSVTGTQVDDTDPNNPIVNPLGLIKIIDLNGELFTDLATAKSYIRTFIDYSTYPITQESYQDGVYYFTTPINTEAMLLGGFMQNSSASFVDELGLIFHFNQAAFFINGGNHIFGADMKIEGQSFYGTTGNIVFKKDVYFNIYPSFPHFENATGTYFFNKNLTLDASEQFALNSNAKFIFSQNIGPTEGANYVGFFSGSTSTIFASASKYTSNAGGIQGDLQTAISNGCNVQFDGINLAKEVDLTSHTTNTSNPHQVTLEQARTQNASLSGDINANTNTIINLKDAINSQEPITKIQFDTYVSSVGGQRGDIDCSLNPNYPASNKGDRWEVTVAGLIGGASGITVQVYDEIVCKTTSVAGTQAAVGVNFYIVQGNLERATETVAGYIQLATDIETQAGTENTKAITSLKLENWWVNVKTLVQTFAAKITFTSAPRFNSATASQYLKTDASKDLTSVGAIPASDITQSTNLRFQTDNQQTFNDATSSIQTQLNSKTKIVGFDTADALTPANTSNNVIKSITIPANTFTNGNVLRLFGGGDKTGTVGTTTIKIYANTVNNLTGSPVLIAQSVFSNTNLTFQIDRNLFVRSTTTWGYASNVNNSMGPLASSTINSNDLAIDWTVTQYIIIAIQLNSGADQVNVKVFAVVNF